MQLILAIVADQQQAAQLAALIDGRLAVDLVQAAEVGEGLLALDDRIPDLILTSPLMSPFDDGVLDEYLRDLGPAGAHVQTLRIPVLSQAPKKAPRLGFSLRRRAKPEPTTPVGCEPKVFADEIAVYLARAAEDKRHASANETAPVIERRVIQDEEPVQTFVADEEWRPAYASDAVDENAAWAAPEPEAETSAWRSDLLDRPVADETPTYETPTCEPHHVEAAAEWQEDTIETSAANEQNAAIYEEVRLTPDTYVEPAQVSADITYAEPVEDEAPVFVEATSAVVESPRGSVSPVAPLEERAVAAPVLVAAVEETVVETPAVAQPIVTPAVVARPSMTPTTAPAVAEDDAHKATPSFKAALAAIRAAWGKPSTEDSPAEVQQSTASMPKESMVPVPDVPAPLEVDLTGAVELLDEPSTVNEDPSVAVSRPFVPADSPETPEVYELSVEPEMNEVAPSLPEPSGDRRKKPAKRANKAVKAKGPRPAQPKSAQDEWGVFDPNRCGFAALVDKLDEEVSDEKVKQPRNSGKARVLSCS